MVVGGAGGGCGVVVVGGGGDGRASCDIGVGVCGGGVVVVW